MIDVHGQHNFSKAIKVAKQVFNTLTEYIQVSQFPFTLGITTSALWLLLVEMFLEMKNEKCNHSHYRCLHPGPMYWQPAESSSQSAVGCCGGFPSCLCPHADEALSGIEH